MKFPTTFMAVYAGVVTALLGLVMGSFLNCAAWRMTHGESVAKGRSHCAACGHTLSALDLVPVFSWFFLKGRCRYCGERISPVHPLAELICAGAYTAVVLHFTISWETVEYLILVSLLFCASCADLYDYIIPDRLIVAGIVCRLIFVCLGGDVPAALLQTLIGGLSISLPVLLLVLVMEKILKKEAMGGGDIKLFFVVGLYFNWKVNLVGLLFACVCGIGAGLLSQRVRLRADRHIPFGPSIAAGWFAAMLAGGKIIDWYMGLFM